MKEAKEIEVTIRVAELSTAAAAEAMKIADEIRKKYPDARIRVSISA